MDEAPMGQLILGTDKRNPVFAVYEDEAGERLRVFLVLRSSRSSRTTRKPRPINSCWGDSITPGSNSRRCARVFRPLPKPSGAGERRCARAIRRS